MIEYLECYYCHHLFIAEYCLYKKNNAQLCPCCNKVNIYSSCDVKRMKAKVHEQLLKDGIFVLSNIDYEYFKKYSKTLEMGPPPADKNLKTALENIINNTTRN